VGLLPKKNKWSQFAVALFLELKKKREELIKLSLIGTEIKIRVKSRK
jgi:hypothetical protein